jgi:NifU-like protein involved in Fe-S cluster formation
VAGAPNRGPFLILDLLIRGDIISDARFQTYGCGPAIACGSMLTVLIIGRSIAEARSLSAAHLVKALDGLPDDKRHCADLAISALRDALKDDVPA